MSSPSPELPHIATFHTHYGALCFQRRLAGLGERAVLAPVPRKLSVSCGTCVRYGGETPCPAGQYPEEVEQVVAVTEQGYEGLYRAENG